MKLNVKDLRKIVKEEYSRAIPEFVVRQTVESCVEDLKRAMVNHINSKSNSQQSRQKMIARMNLNLEELEKDLKELIDEKISKFFSEI
jgi:hypothetical protein